LREPHQGIENAKAKYAFKILRFWRISCPRKDGIRNGTYPSSYSTAFDDGFNCIKNNSFADLNFKAFRISIKRKTTLLR